MILCEMVALTKYQDGKKENTPFPFILLSYMNLVLVRDIELIELEIIVIYFLPSIA